MWKVRPLAHAGVVGIAALVRVSAASAQSNVPVFVASETGEADRSRSEDTAALARVLGARVLVGPALSAAIDERFASRGEWQDTLAPVRTRIARSRRAYGDAIANQQQAVADALLGSLEQDADALLAQPVALDRSRETREALMSASLFVAEATHTSQPARAIDALRKLASAFPEITLGPRAASAAVRTLFREQVAQVATASLVVQSVPDSCQVRRNGVIIGSAPAQLQSLAAGQHRVSIRCGGVDSLVHRVNVGAGTTSTVQIDISLDRAVRFGDAAGFQYPDESTANTRSVIDAANVASALGAERTVVYRVRTRRAVVIDVLTRTVVRELEPSEYARLPDVLRGAGAATNATSGVARTEPPRVAVRPRIPTRVVTNAQRPVTNVAPSGALLIFGVVFVSAGGLFGLGGAGAWIGANYARTQALLLGQDGLQFSSVSRSVTSAEPPLRTLAVGTWIASGGLLATGVTMLVLGATRREPAHAPVRAMIGPSSVGFEGAF